MAILISFTRGADGDRKRESFSFCNGPLSYSKFGAFQLRPHLKKTVQFTPTTHLKIAFSVLELPRINPKRGSFISESLLTKSQNILGRRISTFSQGYISLLAETTLFILSRMYTLQFGSLQLSSLSV